MAPQSLWEAQRREELVQTADAMWRFLKTQLKLDDTELLTAINHHRGLASSAADHRLGECALCRRPLQRTARCCLYCGQRPA